MATLLPPSDPTPGQDAAAGGHRRLAAIEQAARELLAAQDDAGLQDALHALADAVDGRDVSTAPWPGWDRWYAEKRQQVLPPEERRRHDRTRGRSTRTRQEERVGVTTR